MPKKLRTPVYRPGQSEVTPYQPQDWSTSTDPRVVDVLAFEPKKWPLAWSRHKAMVVDWVCRQEFHTTARDRDFASTYHQFLCFAEQRGWAMNPPTLLCNDRFEEFLQQCSTEASAATHRYRLRRIATLLYPPPPERTYERHKAQDPLTGDDARAYLAAAHLLIRGHHADSEVRQRLHRDVVRILALTFGAGCNSRSVHTVREGWLEQRPDGLWLNRPDRSVPTPVSEPWASLLCEGLSGDPEAWLIRPHSTDERGTQVGKVMNRARKMQPALSGFDADRAARRWMADLLAASGFATVAAVCGFQPGHQLPADMIRFLDPVDAEQACAAVRGWVR